MSICPQETDLCFIINNMYITYEVNVFLVFCLFFKNVMSFTSLHSEENECARDSEIQVH